MSEAFSWIVYPDGSARFVGLQRGSDEMGHELFAIDRGDGPCYGEVAGRYAGDDLTIEIVSFGYTQPEAVGAGFAATTTSSPEADAVAALVRRLIDDVAARESRLDKPSLLRLIPPERFTGDIVVRPGWFGMSAVSTKGSA